LGNLQEAIEKNLKNGQTFSESDVIYYLCQLSDALAFMHAGRPSIAHRFFCFVFFRDVKPANLLFKAERHLVLTDFGSAIMVPIEVGNNFESQALKDEAAEFCTMPYRAPELFNCDIGQIYDHRMDTWSSGCVLYALCFLKSPFDDVIARGDSVPLAVMSYKFRSSSVKQRHSFSDSLLELLPWMLNVSPVERPSCALVLRLLKDL